MAQASLLVCLVAALGLVTAQGMYSANSPVLQIDAKNYDSLIAQSNYTSILEFYAPWCGHCQNLKPAYEKAAKSLHGLAKVAAVNCDDEVNKSFCAQFGVQGFPTLKLVKPGKKPGKPVVEDYQGPREAKAIIEAVSDKISNHVKRLKADTLETWLHSSTTPKAILFSEKSTTAPLVKALAIDFLGAIEFAQVRSKETAALEKYNIAKLPTLVLVQGDEISKYDREINKEALTKFLSQAASVNPDPAPRKANAKSTSTKTSKTASAAEAFSEASKKHKSADFEEHLEHASTVVVDDDIPVKSPHPKVEHKQKPMVIPDVAPPLPTLETSSELRSACLQADSTHCILILLPQEDDPGSTHAAATAEALLGFATVQDKYKKRKASIPPAYVVPAINEDGIMIRQALGLEAENDLQVVVLNRKKGFAKRYLKTSFDTKSIEGFMDDIRFGEGSKQKLPVDFFAASESAAESTIAEEAEQTATEPASASQTNHDELMFSNYFKSTKQRPPLDPATTLYPSNQDIKMDNKDYQISQAATLKSSGDTAYDLDADVAMPTIDNVLTPDSDERLDADQELLVSEWPASVNPDANEVDMTADLFQETVTNDLREGVGQSPADEADDEMKAENAQLSSAGSASESDYDILNHDNNQPTMMDREALTDHTQHASNPPPAAPAVDIVQCSKDDIALLNMPASASSGLGPSQYCPSDIPTFRGRSSSVSPTCGTHYSSMANWPPPKPPTCELDQRIDIFPSKDAPLHVWIQAYALRWGVWCAEIKDEAARERVLAVVTDKMKTAWETAITEGYYLRPAGDITADHQRGDSDGQGKRGRKRAQSPSKLPAGFVHEGRDALAITSGELAKYDITMEMIKERVRTKTLEAGELRLDEVLGVLGRDELTVKDWSANGQLTVHGRNLLMYAMHVVQDARTDARRLQVLYDKFDKPVQKRNTQVRIDVAQERALQHLALVTELTLREQAQSVLSEEAESHIETVPTDLINDVEHIYSTGQAATFDKSITEPPVPDKRAILELARDVLTASTEAECGKAFATRKYLSEDFATTGPDAGEDQRYQTAKRLLGEILGHITQVIRMKQMMKGQQPSEVIRIGMDARMVKERIGRLRSKLHAVLGVDLNVTSVTPLDAPEAPPIQQSVVDSQPPAVGALDRNSTEANTASAIQSQEPVLASDFSTSEAVTDNTEMMSYAPSRTSTPAPQRPPSAIPEAINSRAQAQHLPLQHPTNSYAIQSSVPLVDPEGALKQAYINELWVPNLNRALENHGQPLIRGIISSWPPIKDVLTQLGLSAEERNIQLSQFKQGFTRYLQKHGVRHNNVTTPSSSAPTVATISTPTTSQASARPAMPTNWPTETEVLRVIPPHGIAAHQLIEIFGSRVAQQKSQFIKFVASIANYNEANFMVYTRPPETPRHNTMPPQGRQSSQGFQKNMQPSQYLPQPPSQARPGLLKLKVPQAQSAAAPNLSEQDESDFPDEFKSTEINSSRGFSFRHLPHATLEQRKRMDEEVGEYIAKTCKSRKKNPFGSYITFKDPEDPNGPDIAHGFWDFKNGGHRSKATWFYNGEDMPEGWSPNDGDEEYATTEETQVSVPAKPRIKLNVNSTLPNEAAQGPYHANHNPYNRYGNYNTLPPGYAPPATRGLQVYGGQPMTVNPAHLMKTQPQPQYDYMPVDQGVVDHGQGQGQSQGSSAGAGIGTKKGTKRAGSAVARGVSRKKKRKTNVIQDDDDDDDDDDGEYKPDEDF